MEIMQRMLFRNAIGGTAELMRTPYGYRVTMWDVWSMTDRKTFPTWGKATAFIYSNGYRKM